MTKRRGAPRNNSTRNTGYQLLELLIVLSIIAVVITIGIHNGISARTRTKQIAYEVSELIQAARMHALEAGTSVHFCSDHQHEANKLHLLIQNKHTTQILREYTCTNCSIHFYGFRKTLFFNALGENSTNGQFNIQVANTQCRVIINDAGRTRIEC